MDEFLDAPKPKLVAPKIVALKERLELVAEMVLEDNPKADQLLKAVLKSLPMHLRKAGKVYFVDYIIPLVKEDYRVEGELTEVQKQVLIRLREMEKGVFRNLLSATSLRKIRAIFLHQPQLISQVLLAGKELGAKGVGATYVSPGNKETGVMPNTVSSKDNKTTAERNF